LRKEAALAADAIARAAASVTEGVPERALAEAAQVAAVQAKIANDRFAYATASRLFDADGASAERAARRARAMVNRFALLGLLLGACRTSPHHQTCG
jgi:hypothetical protein